MYKTTHLRQGSVIPLTIYSTSMALFSGETVTDCSDVIHIAKGNSLSKLGQLKTLP